MNPESANRNMSMWTVLRPSPEQLQHQQKQWENARLIESEAAIREWAMNYPLAPQIPLAKEWLLLNREIHDSNDARAGRLTMREGCRFVEQAYECLPATNAFDSLNQPSTSLLERQPRMLATASRVRVLPQRSGQVSIAATDRARVLSAEQWTREAPLQGTTQRARLSVVPALRPATWQQQNISLHPCRIDTPARGCPAIDARRFTDRDVRQGRFEVLAVAALPSSPDRQAQELARASEYAVALAAELVRRGARPDRVSYFYADASFSNALRGLAFVRRTGETP
jgi:hypothetical protein